jgi:hypothetical protein
MGLACLVLLAFAILGQSRSTTVGEYGLTDADIKAVVDGHNQWRTKANAQDMYKIVSKITKICSL